MPSLHLGDSRSHRRCRSCVDWRCLSDVTPSWLALSCSTSTFTTLRRLVPVHELTSESSWGLAATIARQLPGRSPRTFCRSGPLTRYWTGFGQPAGRGPSMCTNASVPTKVRCRMMSCNSRTSPVRRAHPSSLVTIMVWPKVTGQAGCTSNVTGRNAPHPGQHRTTSGRHRRRP